MTPTQVYLKQAHELGGQLGTSRIYSVKEVACRYYPNLSPQQASRRFRTMMRLDEELMQGLRRRGFRDHQRLLSPAMLALILEHLGLPEL